MKSFVSALCANLILVFPAFAGEDLPTFVAAETEEGQSVLLMAGYDGTIRAVDDVIPFKGDGIIDLRDEASFGVTAVFPPKLAGQHSFTDLAVGKKGVILGADIQGHTLVFEDLFFKRVDLETFTVPLIEEPWSVLVRGETIIYGMRYADVGQAPYAVSWLEEGPNGMRLQRYIPSGNKPFPKACTALESRSDGSVLCLDTDITGSPRNGRFWLIPGSILCSTCLGDPVMIYESPRLVSMAVDEDSNYVFVALKETKTEEAEILHLNVDLRSRSVVGEPELVARGNLLHFDPQMANAFVFEGGQAYVGVNWLEPDGSQLLKAVVRVNPMTGDQSIYVSPDVVGTNNPIALTWWPQGHE